MKGYLENIIVGQVSPEIAQHFFAYDMNDWLTIEAPKTHFTNETYLPQLLVDIGVAPSKNEIKRNRPELLISLTEPYFHHFKWGKKHVFVLVGDLE